MARLYVKEWRQHRGMSLEKAAETMGITMALLSGIEAGRTSINVDKVEMIAKALHVQPGDLWLSPEIVEDRQRMLDMFKPKG